MSTGDRAGKCMGQASRDRQCWRDAVYPRSRHPREMGHCHRHAAKSKGSRSTRPLLNVGAEWFHTLLPVCWHSTVLPCCALYGGPMLEDGLEALGLELLLGLGGGIGIAINSDGHSVERIGAALEHKRWEILLLEGFRQRVCVVFVLHRGHLKCQTR